ncbi:MAG: hypothetical protein IJH99_09660 [Eubacterium sp.]|nr:hypothetical protein [Eubacterium sp.]
MHMQIYDFRYCHFSFLFYVVSAAVLKYYMLPSLHLQGKRAAAGRPSGQWQKNKRQGLFPAAFMRALEDSKVTYGKT